MSGASEIIGTVAVATLKTIEQEVSSRAYRASNELRNASQFVLRGQRSGRQYRIPGSKRYYTASAPGEAPANRLGTFRASWGTHVHAEKNGRKYRVVSAIESGLRSGKYLLGDVLEKGTPRIKKRPYKQAVRDRAKPKILAIYRRPYTI